MKTEEDAALRRSSFFQFLPDDVFEKISSLLMKLSTRDWPIYLGPREVWRKTGDRESGQREVFVQDPDGYLVMLAQSIGERS